MKTIKITTTLILFTSLFFSCQNEKKELIDITIFEENGLDNFNVLPRTAFNVVTDSAQFLFDEQDYYRILSSEIKVSPPIFQNDVFKVRVFVRKTFVGDSNEFGFLVRTYTKDGKIKDEKVIASSSGDLRCEGKVTSDLKIITTCPEGYETVAQIENDGSIKLIENE
ncbi:MAG: hypothetical protein ABF274_12795 [Nonlabens sp.]|uniref:hypothetical protein n=1 Tax=Nonlabens sp. TaxID=1888209 RepID=UPI00321B9843